MCLLGSRALYVVYMMYAGACELFNPSGTQKAVEVEMQMDVDKMKDVGGCSIERN